MTRCSWLAPPGAGPDGRRRRCGSCQSDSHPPDPIKPVSRRVGRLGIGVRVVALAPDGPIWIAHTISPWGRIAIAIDARRREEHTGGDVGRSPGLSAAASVRRRYFPIRRIGRLFKFSSRAAIATLRSGKLKKRRWRSRAAASSAPPHALATPRCSLHPCLRSQAATKNPKRIPNRAQPLARCRVNRADRFCSCPHNGLVRISPRTCEDRN